MVGKLLKTEQGIMVLLPEEALTALGLTLDSDIDVTIKPDQGQIIISTAESLPGVDEEFARQVTGFIDQYRPALEALAK